MNKRKIKIILISICLILVAVYFLRLPILFRIEDIVSEAINDDNYDGEYISQENRQKILDDIYKGSTFDKNARWEGVECSTNIENWIKGYVWVDVWLLKEQGMYVAHYKCYFITRGCKVYITAVGVPVDTEGGDGMTDLDFQDS